MRLCWKEGIFLKDCPLLDRRVRKTRTQLRQGLTQLMEQKNINEITVKELTELVDMNRSTFYAHYRDIYDLLESLEREMFESFSYAIQNTDNIINTRLYPLLLIVYEFLAEYSDMCMILLGKNGDMAFVDRLESLVKEKCLKDWMQIHKNEMIDEFEFCYAYTVAGCIGLCKHWLSTNMDLSPRRMAELTERIITYGIHIDHVEKL